MRILKKIGNSEGFKITSINSISVIVKIISGLISSKVLALLTGPQGIALLGNFRNFASTIDSIATLGFQNGIVKYVAENKENREKLDSLYATLLLVAIIISVSLGTVLFVFSDYWNTVIFGDTYHFALVFKLMGFILPISILGSYLVAVINGFSNYKEVIYINIIANILSLLCTIFLVYYLDTKGAILSVVFTSAILFFLAVWYFPNKKELVLKAPLRLNCMVLKELSHYLIMIVISGVLGQILQIYIRNLIIGQSGIASAGYWEAMNRISSNYMLFINTLLSVYYYPKLINAGNSIETKMVFKNYYKTIIPLFITGALFLYFIRIYLVKLLLTDAFESVTTLFFWQLIGDFFKTISWILGFQFLAKRMTKQFLFFEIVSFLILFFISIYCIPMYKTQGAVMAFALSYAIYWMLLMVYFRKILFHK